MKKLLILSLVILFSCQNKQEEKVQETLFVIDSSKVFIPEADTLEVDSVEAKISTLLHNTENASKKLREIKAIKQENKILKQELIETKAELAEVKAALVDTLAEPTHKKRKTFIQKVISTLKKDTVQ